MVNDLDILQSFSLSRDPALFATLVERHAVMVYSAAYRVTRNAADADDVTQECFLELTRRATQVRTSVIGWLHLTATRRAVNLLRGKSARQRSIERARMLPVDLTTAAWTEIAPILDEVIAELPDELRVPLIGHFLEGRPMNAIAEELAVSPQTIARRIDEAVQSLRRAMHERGVSPDGPELSVVLPLIGMLPLPAGVKVGLAKIGILGLGQEGVRLAAQLAPHPPAALTAAAWTWIAVTVPLALLATVCAVRATLPTTTDAAPDTSGALPPPALAPGRWVDISPAGIDFRRRSPGNPIFTQGFALDPGDPRVMYLCVDSYAATTADGDGLYKSSDRGSSWTLVGRIPAGVAGEDHLTEPIRIRIDPRNRQHVYAGDGVRGHSNGFWVSQDGGLTFAMPAGFRSWSTAVGSTDVYDVAADPADFDHVLLAFHSAWRSLTANGVAESTDGGRTWITHPAAEAAWSGAMSIHFIAGASNWLAGTQHDGLWLTADAGTSWSKVNAVGIELGGGEVYHSASGVLFASSQPQLLRSADHGRTWTAVGPAGSYDCVCGDGTRLYAGSRIRPSSVISAAEGDGGGWSALSPQLLADGPFDLACDRANRILYDAAWSAGLWALALPGSATSELPPPPGAVR